MGKSVKILHLGTQQIEEDGQIVHRNELQRQRITLASDVMLLQEIQMILLHFHKVCEVISLVNYKHAFSWIQTSVYTMHVKKDVGRSQRRTAGMIMS